MADEITLITESGTYDGDDAIEPIKNDLIQLRDGLQEVAEELEQLNLKEGPPGPKGDPGERGPPGVDGRDGADGRDGERGPPGADGAPGRDGVDGKDGRDGVDGVDGRNGERGPQGEPGLPGADGKPGADGAPGRDGAPGPKGDPGERGPPGERGERGPPGRDGVDGAKGRDGAPGPKGDPGADGAPGRDGVDGADGRDGRDGVDGERGERGPPGPKGDPGERGERGPPGFDGRPGYDGAGLNWRGAYQPNTNYYKNDIVRDKGSAWIALSTTQDKPHLESSVWDLLVPRGRAGPAGPAGPGGGVELPIAASDVTVTNEGYDTAQDVFDALLYVALVINSFTGGGNYEIGATVNNVNLAWSYNKDVTSQSINQGIGSLDPADRAEALTGLGLTTNRTWTLSATDGTTPRTANTTVAFLPKRYWGVWEDDAPDNTDILTLSQELTSSRAKSVSYDCTGGRFPVYAWPVSLGALSGVTVGGLAFSDYTVSTMSFTNAQGYTQDYYVFVFNTIQTGAAINVVFS